MFNLGFGEMIVIGMIALIFIGPKQLPEVARTLAKLINEVKRAVGDVSGSFKKSRTDVDDWVKDLSTQIANATQEPKKEESPIPEPEKKQT
jgi:sec-independent protein translocase protein TatB